MKSSELTRKIMESATPLRNDHNTTHIARFSVSNRARKCTHAEGGYFEQLSQLTYVCVSSIK